MSAELLLSRLSRVKRTGPGRWIASSPTRDDKSPSLAVRELDDGTVLLHDFGGDSVEEILGAVGLEFSDLYPPKLSGAAPIAKRRLIGDRQTLDLLHSEAQLIALVGSNLARGETLSEADLERTLLAAGRIAYLRDEVMS